MSEMENKYKTIISERIGQTHAEKILQASLFQTTETATVNYFNINNDPKQFESVLKDKVWLYLDSIDKDSKVLEFSLEKLKRARPWDLDKKSWRLPLKRKENKDDIKILKNNLTVDPDEICRKCKKNECVMFDLKQMRSADEPMTEMWRCKNCGARWNS